MMETNNKLDIFYFEKMLVWLANNKANKDSIINELGEVKKDNNYGSFFLKPKEKKLKVIILNFNNSCLNSISFLGDLKITFQSLIERYGVFEEVYSRYDDQYIYYFKNSLNKVNNYSISCRFNFKYKEGVILELRQIEFILE